MEKPDQMISYAEAAHEVELACRRLGMLHLAYARTLVQQFGREQGEKLIMNAIKEYGKMVGEQTSQKVSEQGLANEPQYFGEGQARSLPKLGLCEEVVHENDQIKVKNCSMAKVWREFGEEDLGSLYCFIDTAKYMYYNPNYKLTHVKAMPAHGTDYCQFELEETTEQERADFFANKDWRYLDKRMMKGSK